MVQSGTSQTLVIEIMFKSLPLACVWFWEAWRSENIPNRSPKIIAIKWVKMKSITLETNKIILKNRFKNS